MKKVAPYFIILLVVLIASCSSEKKQDFNSEEDPFIRAADISFIPLIESEGTIYKHNSIAQDPLLTLKNAGCNTVRIRLWKNPISNQSSLEEVKILSQRAKQMGFKIWLCVHYSDTWADPRTQNTPALWENLSFENLKLVASDYTSLLLTEINPDIIQIGNEINNGFMWPKGNFYSNQSQCLQLLSVISTTIRNQSPSVKIMLHYAGIGNEATVFYNKLTSVSYDYIGLSYYPIWHGKNLTEVTNTINSISQTYNKKVLIAETSYPFTFGYNDWTNNIIGDKNQILSNFSATNMDQKNFLLAIKNLVKESPNGIGFCYWGTEWVAFRGVESTNGSSWENQALWDFNNNSLPAMDAFKKD